LKRELERERKRKREEEEMERAKKRKVNLGMDVSRLLNSHDMSDLTVICQGEELPCHRLILAARSPVFARGLASGGAWTEAEGRWTVQGAEPVTVKDMLGYIYTSDIPEEALGARAGELLELASQYELPELEEACREALMKGLSLATAVSTLVLLDRHQGPGWDKEEVINFIKKNAKDIVKGTDWKMFVANYPDLVTDIVTSIVS
jgi:hypothetical protein